MKLYENILKKGGQDIPDERARGFADWREVEKLIKVNHYPSYIVKNYREQPSALSRLSVKDGICIEYHPDINALGETLAHEYGHCLMDHNTIDLLSSVNTRPYIQIEEEITAWIFAEKLLKSCNQYEEQSFSLLVEECLRSYLLVDTFAKHTRGSLTVQLASDEAERRWKRHENL